MTKQNDGIIYRRRYCKACDHRWYTLQPQEQFLPNHLVIWTHDSVRHRDF